MIIIKNSFYDFIKARNPAIYDEMARPDTSFEGSDEKYPVSSRTPIFTDEYDIYYLYQFPPAFWTAAMAARYNHFLLKAKNEGDDYNDIQDVAIKGQGGTTIIFKNRNTYAKHLVDKIQRDVDVDFFRKHGKDPEHIEKYSKEAEGHRASGKDLGGYIGASLEDPKPHKQKIGSYKTASGETKDRYEDIWTAKGFMAPSQSNISQRLEAWMKGSSEGWLQPLSDSHVSKSFNTRGGKGRPKKGTPKKESGDERKKSTREYKSFTGDHLEEIWKHMKKAKALPFRIEDAQGGLVTWPEVTVRNKKGEESTYNSFTGSKETKGLGEPVPVLFDGAAIHSHDMDAYEAAQKNLVRFSNLGPEDFKQLQSSDLMPEIRRLREEISRKDMQDLWDTDPNTDISKERKDATERLAYLEGLQKLRQWTKEKFPDQPVNSLTIQEALPKFIKSLQNDMNQLKANARKYKEHHWNTHEYNRDREAHDPLGVGMDNPTTSGPQKYESLSNRTRGFGVIWPNRKSKHMMHGTPGEWEEKYQKMFGAADKNPSHLSAEDKQELEDHINTYLNRIGQKLASDKETLTYLGLDPSGHRPDLVRDLANPTAIRNRIQEKHSDVEFNSKHSIVNGDVPKLLAKGYQEILDTWQRASELYKEIETGISGKSAIAEGVRKYLKLLYKEPAVQTAMESMQELVARNAENYIRRTIGHSAWRNFEEASKKGGIAKHKAAMDLKSFIEAKAYSYAGLVAQLKLGDDIDTRRIRYNRNAKRTFTAARDSEDQAYDVSDDEAQTRMQHRQDAPATKQFNDFGKGQHKPGATRWTRSDSLSGVVGSNVDNMYKYLLSNPETANIINKDAQHGVEELKDKIGAVGTPEADMIKGISTSVAFFFIVRNDYIDEMKERGTPVKDTAEADKVARQRVIDHFKKNKWISSNYDDAAQTQPGIAARQGGGALPNIDRKVPEDEAERMKLTAYQLGARPDPNQPQPEVEPTPQLTNPMPQKVVPVARGLAGRIKRPNQPPQLPQ